MSTRLFEDLVRAENYASNHTLSKMVFVMKHGDDPRVRNLLQTIATEVVSMYKNILFLTQYLVEKADVDVHMNWDATVAAMTTNAMTIDFGEELYTIVETAIPEVRYAIQHALMNKGYVPKPKDP